MEPRLARAVLPAILVLSAACGGPEADSGPLPANGRPVVLISIDSLRADHCTPYGYQPEFSEEPTTPFLDRMAREGVLFENAQSSTSWTLPAHASLLTGMDCLQHGVRNREHSLDPETELLAGRFRRAGYATGGFYSAPFLAPIWGFFRGFDRYLAASPYLASVAEVVTDEDPKALLQAHEASHQDARCSERVVDAALDWLEEEERWKGPFFLFLHLWDPHYDYQPPEDYARRFQREGGRLEFLRFMESDWPREILPEVRALYDAEIRYTDDQIARLFARLEEWGIADRVIFAVTSDHGDEFFEHEQKGHQKTLFQEVTHIPMVVRAPGLVAPGLRQGATVALYDLAPTLLDLAGVPPWEGRRGRSLAAWAQEAERPDLAVLLDLHMHFARGAHWSGVVEGRNKFLWDEDRSRGLLFDLGRDPGERRPQRLESPDAAEFSRYAWSLLEEARRARPYAPAPALSPEMENTLAQLGYTEGE